MKFDNEIEVFINDFVKDLNEGTASIFAGAGLSIPAGFVSWSELMAEIAQDLGLDINTEKDLVSIAQFHVNENRNRTKINRKILEEFTEDAKETENHRIIAGLPINSIWTTNYDELIEKSFINENKIIDVKHNVSQLLTTKNKRDVVIFKMHGDVKHPNSAIITKEQYEQYYQTHEPFINALAGELTTKTFLFIGFSFTDPNLDYILSRLNFRYREEQRQHYCFVKKPVLGDNQNPDVATLSYNKKKQALIINDLKRYGIKSLKVDNYSDITQILNEINFRYKKRTVFISGSVEVYEPFDKDEAISFIHLLSKRIVEADYKIVNGFGRGIGSSVINGALEAIYNNPLRFSENQLILKPFPQFASGDKSLKVLWEDYRRKMISKCGISIFIFGNKKNEYDEIIEADGVIREFEISKEFGNICIPIGITSHATNRIYQTIKDNPEQYYESPDLIMPFIEKLADSNTTLEIALKEIDKLIKQLKK